MARAENVELCWSKRLGLRIEYKGTGSESFDLAALQITREGHFIDLRHIALGRDDLVKKGAIISEEE